jgi:hypothetical protein
MRHIGTRGPTVISRILQICRNCGNATKKRSAPMLRAIGM